MRVGIVVRLRCGWQDMRQRLMANKFMAFLPAVLRASIHKRLRASKRPPVLLPATSSRQAAVLFADVSGFTRLTQVVTTSRGVSH